MEGKKRRALGQNCHAVSEVYGQLLMISIVVLAFSGIAVTVFSDGGAVKPEHIPHTDLQETINTRNNTIEILHSGGEAIDLSAIKIVLYVDEQPTEFSMSEDGVKVYSPDNIEFKDGAFMLGDRIVIDTEKKGLDLKAGANIDMFFVDTPSQQVVQRTVLQKSYGKIPDWITPHPYGSVYDNSTYPGEWLPTELVDGINDGFITECQMRQGEWSNETFTFGIDADDMNIKNPLKAVLLKIVYSGHDSSMKNLTLEINDKNPDQWIIVDYEMTRYNSYIACDQNLQPYNLKLMNLGVNTTEELENLSVRFSAYGNAASPNKVGWVDFIGVHVEY
jgi:FlaG/FlaF family flagellin (archaellin)